MAAELTSSSATPTQSVPGIQLRFFGSIRVAAQKISEEWEHIPGTTVYSLMQALSGAFGQSMRDELLDDNAPGGLREDLMVTVNEAIISKKDAGVIMVDAGDSVSLFPMFPGGG